MILEKYEDLYPLCSLLLYSGKINIKPALPRNDCEYKTIISTVDFQKDRLSNIEMVNRAIEILIDGFNEKTKDIEFCDDLICHPFQKDDRYGFCLVAIIDLKDIK